MIATTNKVGTAIYDFEEARRIYDNCVRSGVPVISWEDFVSAGLNMIAADEEFRSAVQEASEMLDKIEPTPRYPGWQNYAPTRACDIDELLLWAAEVNNVHPSDFRFQLIYGKSRRNPLSAMDATAKRLRLASRKTRKALTVE